MKRSWVWIVVAVFAALAMVVTGCQTGAPKEAEEGDAIKIGAVLAVTGPAAPLGEAEKATLELMEKEINDAGGINGRLIEIIIEDSETNPEAAQAATTKLIEQDKVVALVGGTSSPEALAMMPEAEKAGIPYLSMAADDSISDPVNSLVFQTPPRTSLIVERVVEHLKDDLGIKKFAVLYDANAFGSGGYEALKKQAPEAGLEITAAESYETAATDLSAQVNKVKGSNPEAVVIWGTNPGPAQATKTIRELGMTVPIVGSHGIANQAFIDLAGEGKSAEENPANGVVFPAGPILLGDKAEVSDEQMKVMTDFAEKFEAQTGGPPNTFAGHAYDAIGMLKDALSKAGADDAAKLRDAVEQTTGFVGIQGVFTYSAEDHNGLTTKDVSLIEVKDGKWVPYEADAQ